MEKYIISHKSPDTDTICSSLVYSNYLRKKKNMKTKVCKLGDINSETKFVLEKFGFNEPETVESLPVGSGIILMDHNEAKQSIDNIDNYKIIQIIDHHKMDFSTKEPLFIRSEPIGSTCSIVSKMFFEDNIELTKEEAGLLISAIISDTLYFRSPTTTKEDVELVKKLNEIAKIDKLEEYSLEMFRKKSDLGNIDIDKLVKMDYKEFNLSGKKVGVGVIETTTPDYSIKRCDEISTKLNEIIKEDGLDYVFLSVVDILNENNVTIVGDNETRKVLEDVFKAKPYQEYKNILELGRVLSRKKQIIPKLEEYFSN